MKWFGVVRKKSGGIKISSCDVNKIPSHRTFLREQCGFVPGDTVLEVFSNETLTHEDFLSYARDFYLNERPLVQPLS